MKSIDFGAEIDGTEDFFQMFWPVTVSHKITEDSELYDISARDISCRWQEEIYSLCSESILTQFVFLSENNLKLSWHWRELPQRLGTLSRLVSDQISVMIHNFAGNWGQPPLFMAFIKGALSIVNIDAWLALGADILCSQRDTLGISLWEFVCYLR